MARTVTHTLRYLASPTFECELTIKSQQYSPVVSFRLNKFSQRNERKAYKRELLVVDVVWQISIKIYHTENGETFLPQFV